MGSIRSMISIVAHHGWGIHQLDVNMTFLNDNLKEEVYIWQPHGFLEPWKENMVCKLNKMFYRLNQPSKAWYMKIDEHLLTKGLRRIKSDHNLYFMKNEDSMILFMQYYKMWV